MTRILISISVVVLAGFFIYTHALPTKRPNLSYLLDNARTDPLFALARTNLDRMDLAIDALAEAQQQLASVQTSAQNKRLISALYPTPFLRHMSALERQRRAFLETGTEREADRYLSQLRITIKAYRASLEAFESAFLKAVSEDMPPYELADGRVSRDSILSAVQSLIAKSKEAEQEADRRDACSRSAESGVCLQTKKFLSAAVPMPPTQAVLSAADVAAIRSVVESIEEHVNLRTNIVEPAIPLISISDAECSATYPGPVAFGTTIMKEDGYSYPRPLISGNRRMVDATKHQDVPFYKFFADRGIRFVPASAMLHYQCAGYARDVGAFQTMLGFLAEGMPTALPGLATDIDAVRFIADRQDPDLEVAWRNRSGSYENLLFIVATIERTNTRLSSQGVGIGLSAPFLLYARNAFSVMFMTGNASVAGGVGSIVTGTTGKKAQSPHLFYRSLSPAEQREADRGLEYYLSLHEYGS